MKNMFWIALFVVTVSASAQTPKELDGNWTSVKAENLGNAYGYREFNFKKDSWELKFTMFGDEAMKMPLFTFRATGKYEVGKKESAVKGTMPAVFYFDKKFVTLRSDNPDVVKNMGFSACDLKLNEEKEITANGCSFLVSKQVCGQEFDLISIKVGQLFLGSRPADGSMCTEDKRPTALGEPLKKI
jgi:hypothetical protein